MKRVIERKNLAYNHNQLICCICKRWNGMFEDNDNIFVCKYNNDKKSLFSGMVYKFLNNYKCKYYKRSSKYYTCRLHPKSYKMTTNGKWTNIKHIRGKYKIKE